MGAAILFIVAVAGAVLTVLYVKSPAALRVFLITFWAVLAAIALLLVVGGWMGLVPAD